MAKASELFIQSIKNLPIWVKQVIASEILHDIESKLADFQFLMGDKGLFQYLVPKVTLKGKQEIDQRLVGLSDGYYTFMQDALQNFSIFDITVKNNWSLADSAKIFTRLIELEFAQVKDENASKKIAVALFISGKIKTGEFLKKIGKIDATQLEKAIRYQNELQEEGRHIKMASILIKLGYITDKGLDSLLILKEESRKRLSVASIGSGSASSSSDGNDASQVASLRKELARLENENLIMKKRLKKLLNL